MQNKMICEMWPHWKVLNLFDENGKNVPIDFLPKKYPASWIRTHSLLHNCQTSRICFWVIQKKLFNLLFTVLWSCFVGVRIILGDSCWSTSTWIYYLQFIVQFTKFWFKPWLFAAHESCLLCMRKYNCTYKVDGQM